MSDNGFDPDAFVNIVPGSVGPLRQTEAWFREGAEEFRHATHLFEPEYCEGTADYILTEVREKLARYPIRSRRIDQSESRTEFGINLIWPDVVNLIHVRHPMPIPITGRKPCKDRCGGYASVEASKKGGHLPGHDMRVLPALLEQWEQIEQEQQELDERKRTLGEAIQEAGGKVRV